MMSLSQSPGRGRPARARRLAAMAAALGGLALTVSTAAQAQAATPAARSAAGLVAAPQPITINTTNWTGSAGFGSRAPAWYTDNSGVIHLQGAVSQISTSGTNPNLIGTLPTAARPAQQVFMPVHTFNGTYAEVVIAPSTGDIFLFPPSPPAIEDVSFLSLESISYSTSHPATPIALNTANWEASPCCGTPVWFKDRSGVVHLQGDADQISGSGTSPDLIGTLPATVAPTHDVYTIVACGGGAYADLAIEPNGQITLIDPRPPAVKNYSAVSLSSIAYRPAGAGTPIAVNTANWAGNAGFGSRPPAWYKDSSGVIHLQGAVRQTSTSGTSPNLIGTLPATVAPTHDVFTIVHTFAGTYADVGITPSGQIDLIDPRPPMVKDYTFASLEGITYHR